MPKRKPQTQPTTPNADQQPVTPVPAAKPTPKKKTKKPVASKVRDAVAVTSPPGKTNIKDHLVSWGGAAITAGIGVVSTLWTVIAHVLDATADAIINYLKQIPTGDRPAWVALVAFFAMGLVILNRRKRSTPNYSPVTTPTGSPQSPLNPPPGPPVQGAPLPPGSSVPPNSGSAF